MVALYSVIVGQCSRKLKDRLKAEEDYTEVSNANDVAKHLSMIKLLCHWHEGKRCIGESLWEAKHKFFVYRQADFESNSTHIRNVKNLYEVIEHFGGNLFNVEALLKEEVNEEDSEKEFITLKEAMKAAKNRGLALHAL